MRYILTFTRIFRFIADIPFIGGLLSGIILLITVPLYFFLLLLAGLVAPKKLGDIIGKVTKEAEEYKRKMKVN